MCISNLPSPVVRVGLMSQEAHSSSSPTAADEVKTVNHHQNCRNDQGAGTGSDRSRTAKTAIREDNRSGTHVQSYINRNGELAFDADKERPESRASRKRRTRAGRTSVQTDDATRMERTALTNLARKPHRAGEKNLRKSKEQVAKLNSHQIQTMR